MHSPFFFKQSFYLPTGTNQSKNAANLQYIATRPGADRGDLEPETPDAERDPRERSIEDEFGPVAGTAAGHVKYMGERPGSHGLFDADGVANLKASMHEIKRHEGIVWRDVVSLHEDDAVRLGYTTREAWEDALRRAMPGVAEAMGIREDNLRWVAAFHQKAGHPHCHISFWEKNPERSRGVITNDQRRDMRKAFMNVIYENERAKLYLEKNTIRDLLRDQVGRELNGLGLRQYLRESNLEAEAEHGGPPGLTPVLDDETHARLRKQLEGLAQAMPRHGRIALKYMPPEAKEIAHETAGWLLRQTGFADQAGRFAAINRELAGTYTKQEKTLDKATISAIDDIRDRVAQVLLKGAAEIQKGAEFDQKNPVHALVKFAHNEIDREIYHLDPAKRQDLFIPAETAAGIEGNLEKLAERLKSPGDLRPGAAVIADQVLQGSDYHFKLSELNPEAARGVREALTEQVLVIATTLNAQQQGVMPAGYTLDVEKVAPAIECIRNATSDFVKRDPEETIWTAGTMYRGLTQLGVTRSEAREIVMDWAVGIDVTEKLDKTDYWMQKNKEKGESAPFVAKSSWYRMANNLDIVRDDLIYPALWQPAEQDRYPEVDSLLRAAHSEIDIQVYRLDPAKRQSMIEPENGKIADMRQDIENLAERLKRPGDVTAGATTIADKLLETRGYHKVLAGLSPEAAKNVRETLSEQVIGAATRLLHEQEQKDIPMVLDGEKAAVATLTIQNSSANFVRYDDPEARWTAKAMYRTLTMMGAGKNEARGRVASWAKDTGLDTWQLDKTLIAYDKRQSERAEEGEVRNIVGRKYWTRLERNLNLEKGDLIYPWARERREQQEDKHIDAQYLARYAWGEIDREMYRLDPGQRQAMVAPDDARAAGVTESLEKMAKSIPDGVRPEMAYMAEQVKTEAYAIADRVLEGGYSSILAELNPEAARGVRKRVAEQAVGVAAGMKRIQEQALNVDMRLHSGRVMEAVEALRGTAPDFVRSNPEETSWTARTMYRTLVKLDVDKGEARQCVVDWSRGTGIDAGAIISRYEEQQAGRAEEQIAAEPAIIGRRTWNRLSKNLNLDEDKLPFAWFGFVDDPERKQLDIRFHIDEDRAPNIIQELKNAALSPSGRQEQDWTVRAYAATLHALGVPEVERTQMLRDWSRQSGANIPDAKLRDISERLSLSTDHNFCLGRENWERLNNNLGVSVENPFVFERSSASIVRDVWSGAFRAVERERQKAEARGKIAKMKDERKREIKEHLHQQGYDQYLEEGYEL